jgi:hypothetical protein
MVGPVRPVLAAYLIVYYLLVAGAAATLWRTGLTDYLDRGWTSAAIGAAVALGGLLALLSRR